MRYNIYTGVQNQKLNAKKLAIAVVAALGMFTAAAVPALAAPGDNGSGNGGCIDNVYGNATNPRPSGHGVLPSQSPGPFVNTGYNEPPRNDQTRGSSIGDIMQATTAAGYTGQEIIPLLCSAP